MADRDAGHASRRGAVPLAMGEYLDRLDRASRALPRAQRQDLSARVWLDVAASAGPAPTEERLARALTELGPPEGLVPSREEGGVPLRDPAVVHLLGCSLLTLGVTGIVGVVRMWRSPSWPLRDVVATIALMVAGGALLPLLTPVHPVAGALLGGLGAAAPLAGLLLGAVLLRQRRGSRPSPGEITPIPPEGEADPPPTGGVTTVVADQTPGNGGPDRAGGAARPNLVDSKESS